jgi:hypothetical protein
MDEAAYLRVELSGLRPPRRRRAGRRCGLAAPLVNNDEPRALATQVKRVLDA